jgi:methylated-DNA-[protein]-cysteine S-methyltransferase
MAATQERFIAVTFDAVIAAPFGRIGISLRGETLIDVSFLPASTALVKPKTAAAKRMCAQLHSYLQDPATPLRMPLAIDGTPFQLRVWRALQRVPAGKPVSYGALARELKTSARAIGNACRRNPVPIVVPCHRVVAVGGDGGFMGKRSGRALEIKRWLLEHERSR